MFAHLSKFKAKDSFWTNSLLVPFYFAVLSIVFVVARIVLPPCVRLLVRLTKKLISARDRSTPSAATPPTDEPDSDNDTDEIPEAPSNAEGIVAEFREHVKRHGGSQIFFWKALRFATCLALWGLTVAHLVLMKEAEKEDTAGLLVGQQVGGGMFNLVKKWGDGKKRKHRRGEFWFTEEEWYQLFLGLVFFYTSFLSLLTLLSPLRRARTAATHLASTLLVTFSTYAYRDIWPLGTFTLTPADEKEGVFLWTRVGLLFLAAIFIPLVIPNQYIPIDPKNPQAEPNPEQTASMLSFNLFTFLNPVVSYAYHNPHVPVDKLPPLCDYDRTEHLVKRASKVVERTSAMDMRLILSYFFQLLDPYLQKKPRYMFWNLMRLFWKEYTLMSVFLFVRVVAGFLSPVTIKFLLDYVETGGEGAVVKPWVWIILMFIGPVVGSMAMQLYIFITTGSLVRVEGILTQLVFEHALRIRLVEKPKNEGTSTAAPSAATSAPGSPKPKHRSTAEGSATVVDSDSERGDLPGEGEPEAEGSMGSRDGSETLAGSASVAHSASPSVVLDGKKSAKGSTLKVPQSGKGQATPTTPTPAPAGDSDVKPGDSSNLVGKINNLVTVDTNNIVDGRDFLFVTWYAPLELALCCYFLFKILEWSAVVGIATIVIGFPLPGYVASLVNNVQTERMKVTDARTQGVTEVMSVLRMIKLFAWEGKMQERLEKKREEELVWIEKRNILQLCNWTLNYLLPIFSLLATYSSYTLIWKKQLTAATVFSSMAVFDMLRDQLHTVFWMIPQTIQSKVSLDRMDDYFRNSELLDHFKKRDPEKEILDFTPTQPPREGGPIGFQDATFMWHDEEQRKTTSHSKLPSSTNGSTAGSGTVTPSRRTFRLRVEGDLFFKRGKFNLIVGPTGSGKTSLLYALLGEMHFIPTQPKSWFSLPRDGGVAYAAQESWVQNETIKDNILFGALLEEERYHKVLHQCGLEQDLSLFEGGDETEVGEKGLTLSGGQKARITLARAIYSKAEILLLDDVLAALDVHTAKWIIEKCFRGDLVRGRTVILVTHNVAMAAPLADFVVSLGPDGRIQSQGTIKDALKLNAKLLEETKREAEVEEKAKETIDDGGKKNKQVAGKLIVAEEVAEGHVRWPALKLYLFSLGGYFFWTIVLGGLFCCTVTSVLQTWYLGYWARQYDAHPKHPEHINVLQHLGVYGLILLANCIFWISAFTVYYFGSIRASREIYSKLINTILGTTLRWLDTTPTSRVIARCTQDVRAVDGPIAQGLVEIIEVFMMSLSRLGAVVIITPIFFLPGVVAGALGIWCGQIYIRAQLSVKREMSNARAPVLGHFGAAISGLTSLRAYGAQPTFRKESMKRIDKYIRASRTFYNLNRWISIRMDSFGTTFAAGLAAYLLYIQKGKDASTIGFSLNMAVAFASVTLWLVRMYNEFEVSGNSLERIQDYLEIEQETKPTQDGQPPAYWPASGDIHVENLCARYSNDGPEVLHNLSFTIRSGERIGVVGRTGSGKSSLTLSLLRCIPTTGTVLYDGIDTAKINLEALRGNVTIIPQQPELLTGTLRQNLDPFEQYDDVVLNDALRSAGLFSLQEESDEANIGLDSAIASGGSNLSVGQRQILALARAILRGSKLLILDEATSAIDYETDNVIQTSIRKELKDITLITVAHRLQTIMDADRIMVLNAGRIEEYDTPANLLKNPTGLLRSLVDESGDRDKLYAMAHASGEIGS